MFQVKLFESRWYLSLALNIINFYKEYENRPDQQVKSLRYLYQHYNYLGYNISRETLFNTAMDVVQTFTNKNDVENLAEIIDVLLPYQNMRKNYVIEPRYCK